MLSNRSEMQTLKHVLWIGGPPGSGKTTVAMRIARSHGLRWYGADTQTWAHRDRALRAGHPAAQRWEGMTPEERWVTATPSEMLELSLHTERGPMVVDDLRLLPTSPLTVAEGSPISPAVVSSRMADPNRVVWLIPTTEFHRAQLQELELSRGPYELYRLLAAAIERQARDHAVPILTVDGSRSIDELVASVEHLFASALAAGPRAETSADRRALLRDANAAIAFQVRGYYARPWADGDPDSVVRTFVCECGDSACDSSVELAVGALTAEPVLAPGHG